ncbi:hypothetical protein LINPERHAP2_LOCUS17042, partial [Linum perenne]
EWHRIWNLEVPPKVKNLIWRSSCHVLPTKEALTARGVGVPAACGLCAEYDETAWHLFVECRTARKCWDLAGLLIKTEEARNQRNERVWNGKSRPEELILRHGDESVSEWQQLRRRTQARGNVQVFSKWHPPNREQQLKVNIDAAVFPDRLCHGAGAVIRDTDGVSSGLNKSSSLVPFQQGNVKPRRSLWPSVG